MCDLAPTQISRYEAGRAIPRSSTVGKIAAALNIPYDWLLTGQGEDPVASKSYEVVNIALPRAMQAKLRMKAEECGMTVDEFLIQLVRDDVDASLADGTLSKPDKPTD